MCFTSRQSWIQSLVSLDPNGKDSCLEHLTIVASHCGVGSTELGEPEIWLEIEPSIQAWINSSLSNHASEVRLIHCRMWLVSSQDCLSWVKITSGKFYKKLLHFISSISILCCGQTNRSPLMSFLSSNVLSNFQPLWAVLCPSRAQLCPCDFASLHRVLSQLEPKECKLLLWVCGGGGALCEGHAP